MKNNLICPEDLRGILDSMPKRYAISVPQSTSSKTDGYFSDDEAMDGLPTSSAAGAGNNFKLPKIKTEVIESQSSFQFSQQPVADEVAEKLLKEQKLKAEETQSPKTSSTETSRRRTSRMALIDEDSCDFVAILTSPATRKNRLTDRQKEKLEEVSGPRTTINYMDEESQNGFVKTEQFKKALTAMNFEVEDESVSAPTSKNSENPEILPIDEIPTVHVESAKSDKTPEPVKKTNKRRRLFHDQPVSAFATESSRKPEIANNDLGEILEKLPEHASTKSPEQKRGRKDSAISCETSDDISDSMKSNDSRTIITQQEHAVEQKSRKKPGRPKNSRNRSETTRKSGRLSAIQNNACVTSESSMSNETGDVEKTDDKKESVQNIPEQEAAEKKEVDTTISDKRLSDTEEAIEENIVKSPPKTPRTPSILRVGKRMSTSSSPMTERKRNRVHFGEESLPVDVVSSPLTPRRRPLAEAAKNPFVEATVAASNSNLSDIQSSTNDSSFYPTLADCRDKIDRILPNLVTLCMKTVLDSAKRSLSAVGVKTVGDFASLSKSDIEKFTWIKGRVVGARNVLMQYEKTRNAERREEIVDGSEEKPMDVADAIPPEIEAVSPSSKDSQSVPMETKDNSPPANEVIAQELPKASPISNTPSVESTQPALNVQKTPEASQSPASPISSNTGSSTFTVDPTPVQKDLSVVLSRKNLAPIFCGGLKNFKKEQLCPQKQCEKAKDAEKSFVEDGRVLHRICVSLSNAHTQNHWPSENSSKLLSNINKASILFKNLVQTRGAGDWDDTDLENDDLSTAESDVATDVDVLVAVYKRFSRHHTSPMANNLPWRSVMECVNEAACLLESIFLTRAPNKGSM